LVFIDLGLTDLFLGLSLHQLCLAMAGTLPKCEGCGPSHDEGRRQQQYHNFHVPHPLSSAAILTCPKATGATQAARLHSSKAFSEKSSAVLLDQQFSF